MALSFVAATRPRRTAVVPPLLHIVTSGSDPAVAAVGPGSPGPFLGDTEPGPRQHAMVMIIVVRHRSGSESEARCLALPFVALLLMAIPVIFHAEQLWLFDLTPATFGPSSLRKQ